MYVIKTKTNSGKTVYYSGISVWGLPFEDSNIDNAIRITDYDYASFLRGKFNAAVKIAQGKNLQNWMLYSVEKI